MKAAHRILITTGPDTGVGDPKAAPEVLKGVAEGVERRNHLRPSPRKGLGVGPLGDDAIAVIIRLDDVGVLEARPILMNARMRVEEGLISAGLHPEPATLKAVIALSALLTFVPGFGRTAPGLCVHETTWPAT
jgi:hypothetical protein